MPVGSQELQALTARVDAMDARLNFHLIECAAANGRLAVMMRLALAGIGILFVMVASDNPIVKGALAVVKGH
jgi:hypothetical protein